jgi:hypothetical protein
MTAKPTDGLLVCLAAARAGNLDLGMIERAFGHDGGPASSPIRFNLTPSDPSRPAKAAGSLATFVSRTIFPDSSTTHTLHCSNETSIPA